MSAGTGPHESFPTSHFRLGAFQKRHYPKAPIIESIISFTIELPRPFRIEDFRSFAIHEPSYTESGEERLLTIEPGASSPQNETVSGVRFTSADGRYLLAFRSSAFSVSRLAPYESWEAFRTEAQRLWDLYRSQFGPVRVTAVSVRYINRIEIPWAEGQLIDLRRYFRTFPEVSTDLDLVMAGFQMRLDFPLSGMGARLILNQALLPPASPNPSSLSVLLDSDIVAALESNDEAALWQRCEVLRTAKNDVFESCITNLTRELFQ
jgi:uncharacterized protein (TIGR04255 family)